ncbi:NHL repeat-containing protein [Dendrothele bispora CBS 962.96]|uniref:NHL repeat-containing protein n=1 Tax=Dendrothele bispora (strain CBS 962.96) TaxID=1314807 RepID=A0A4S8L0W5_DENBC|nr:NHL repeat-containing protein [Dendrothele bispora CBS 962.96]
MRKNALLSFLSFALALAVNFTPLDDKPGLIDNGTFGPAVEVVHLFQDEPPIAITIGDDGRAFVTFNRGDLATNPLTFAEIVNSTAETAFPSWEFNTPPGGLVNTSSGRTLGSSDSNHFINAQSTVFDARGRLWVLDTGRPVLTGGDMPPSVPGGPKLVGFDLTQNETTPFKTITFPENVLPALSYLNDIRFDLSANLTASEEGVAYIADSGAHGIIVIDLGTGESWRHLDQIRSVSPVSQFLPSYFGSPTYQASALNPAFHWATLAGGGGGIDGFAISADGKFLYFTPVASRELYRVETAPLLVKPSDDPFSVIRAVNSVQFLGQMGGGADGFETDDTGTIYLSSTEHNSINTYNPKTGLVEPFVRDPMIAWPDTLSVANDGFLYFTVNQLWLSPGYQNGTDKRVKPFALLRVPIQGGPVRLG